MNNRENNLRSLKSKLLLITLSIVAVTMFVLSAVAFFHWKGLIVKKEIKTAVSVTEAFSVFVLNTLIYGETLSLEKEYIIDSYISDFMGRNADIKYINVRDTKGRIIAADNYTNQIDFDILSFGKEAYFQTKIIKSKKYDWIIECTYRLTTGNKSWGILTIGYSGKRMRKEVSSLYEILFGFQLTILIVLFLVLYLFIDKITASLESLTEYVEKLELNSENEVVLAKRKDEVGVLTAAFLNLQHRLRNSRDELLKAEKQVFHAEKLASIGRLASGVAHEINNPLNGIKNCLFSIKRENEISSMSEKYIELAEEGLNNIESVVRKLLGFARKQSDEKVDINLNTEISKVLELLNYRLNKDDILLQLKLDKNLPDILGDALLIQEVLMNLLLNAYDAIQNKGIISIETKYDRDFVKLTIKDNGSGISEKDLDKIFEPFFSTKEQGKGTGLGLSVVVSIVQSLNGEISVKSENNKGTEFLIVFPVGNKI